MSHGALLGSMEERNSPAKNSIPESMFTMRGPLRSTITPPRNIPAENAKRLTADMNETAVFSHP